MAPINTLDIPKEKKATAEGTHLPAVSFRNAPIRARKAVYLSIIPGLGHLSIGEKSRGVVFLTVTAVSSGILLFVLFGVPLLQSAGSDLNTEIFKGLNSKSQSIVALVMYVCLFLAYGAFAAREAFDRALKPRDPQLARKFVFGLPEATSGSYLIHVAVMASLLVLTLITVVKPPEEVKTEVQFELEPPPPPPPPPPKRVPPPPPRQEIQQPKPVQPKPRVQTPKPVAVLPNLPRTEEPSPITDVQPQPSTGESTGTPGPATQSSGDTGNDSGEPDFSSYLAEMEKKIKKAWFPPRGSESKKIIVKFKLNRQGEVQTVRLGSSSGVAMADEAATTAVKNAGPFGTLPKGSDDIVDIRFTFDYNVQGGGATLR